MLKRHPKQTLNEPGANQGKTSTKAYRGVKQVDPGLKTVNKKPRENERRVDVAKSKSQLRRDLS